MRTLLIVVVAGLSIGAPPLAAQLDKGGENESGPYVVVPDWMKPFAGPGYIQGSQGGVFAESADRIFVLNRGELKLPAVLPPSFNGSWGSLGQLAVLATPELRNCILVLDAKGNVVERWTQWDKLFQGGRGPHHVRISPYDPEHHVWVVDDNRDQVFEFTNDGKQLVMTLGEGGVPGNDGTHFARPTDIAFLPDGTFFVTDGYVNSRVVKFDRHGKFVMEWGTHGTGPGQFDLPHAIAIDRERRLYVADRANSRIQVFDENGKFLDQWPNIRRPVDLMISGDQHLWVADLDTNKFLEYDLSGRLLSSWGTQGTYPGALWGVHQFSVDQQGDLFVAEAFGGRTQKFEPKPGAARSALIAPPPPLMPIVAH